MTVLMNFIKILGGIVVGIIIILLIICLIPAKTPKIKNKGKVIPNSIAEIVEVKIGGINQTLLIRGKNINNPVILFLHGGPGQSEIGYIRHYQKKLEERFVVVRWDQRGSGASYSKDIPKDSFTVKQFVKDTNEVTDYLIKRFNQSKIFIAGHSWGTVLGTLAAKNHPEKYLAYISISQYVDSKRNEKISYDFVLSKSKEENNEKALEELKNIGPPLYKTIDDQLIQRKWLDIFGGTIKTEPEKGMISSLFLSSEYTLMTKLNYQKRLLECVNVVTAEVYDINFIDDIKELEVPVYFMVGKYDYTTAFSLIEEFYKQLKAPKKELIWFENSAHLPQLEETEKFIKTIIRIAEENQVK